MTSMRPVDPILVQVVQDVMQQWISKLFSWSCRHFTRNRRSCRSSQGLLEEDAEFRALACSR